MPRRHSQTQTRRKTTTNRHHKYLCFSHLHVFAPRTFCFGNSSGLPRYKQNKRKGKETARVTIWRNFNPRRLTKLVTLLSSEVSWPQSVRNFISKIESFLIQFFFGVSSFSNQHRNQNLLNAFSVNELIINEFSRLSSCFISTCISNFLSFQFYEDAKGRKWPSAQALSNINNRS